jgi:CRISPR-associated protein Cmr5
MSNNRTLEQGRAKIAFEKATMGFLLHEKEYAQHAKRLPMMIKTNGLGATLAFMFSKQKVYGTLLKDIEDWIGHNDNKKTLSIYNNYTEGKSLVQKVPYMNSIHYKAVTIETQAYLNWLRRFAEGLVKEKDAKKEEKK